MTAQTDSLAPIGPTTPGRRDHYPEITLRIGGTRIGIDQRQAADVLDPADDSVIGALPIASTADLDAALAACEAAFGVWRRTPVDRRAAVLHDAAELLRKRAEEQAAWLTREQGKPLRESVRELKVAADMLDWAAEEARRVSGRVIPARGSGPRFVVNREPVGPVAAFSPWNFPATQPMRKLAAALAVGCSVILKPAEETPATALALADALEEADLPPGVLSIVFGDPAMISRHLIGSSVVRKVSFTGSTQVGRQIAGLAAQGIKRCTLELGGHAPALVLTDADVPHAAAHLAEAKYRNAGQACISPSRILVHAEVFDEFLAAFVSRARTLRVGSGLDPATDMGPLANARRLAAAQALIADAAATGGAVVTGGLRIGSRGNFLQPTVLSSVPQRARVMNEEPFAPIAVVNRFEKLEDALQEANRTPYGLAAYAFTKSAAAIDAISSQLDCGLVGINSCSVTIPETPFGGVKDSGYGSEGGPEGLDAYLFPKLVSHTAFP